MLRRVVRLGVAARFQPIVSVGAPAAWVRNLRWNGGAAEEQQAAEAAPAEEQPAAEGEAAAEETPEVTPEQRVAELEAQLEEATKGAHDEKLRLLAEMENTRRIAARDVETAKTYAIQKFAKELLDVADNLERALEAVPAEKADEHPLLETLLDGVTVTEAQLQKTLNNFGVERFGEVGEKFDPNMHEAMFNMPAPEGVEAGCIGQVFKPGYRFKERVVRHAQVGATQ